MAQPTIRLQGERLIATIDGITMHSSLPVDGFGRLIPGTYHGVAFTVLIDRVQLDPKEKPDGNAKVPLP